MNFITVVVLVFAILGALDKMFGDRFGLGKEFERGFSLFSSMVLYMLGMLVIAPAVGVWMTPVFDSFYELFGIDPSIIPASIFSDDMGGMTLAQSVCKSEALGNYNGFIVSSMMGCVISFTIPLAVGVVKKEQHKALFFGLLCGIVTIPVGCFVSGLMCGLSVLDILLNLLPLLILSGIIVLGLLLAPDMSIKIFSVFGKFIRIVALSGLILAIFTFLTKQTVCRDFDSLENAAMICVNACITLSGTLPMMYLVTKLLGKRLDKLGGRLGINSDSAAGFLSTVVTNVPTFGNMDKMNNRGAVLNSAFAVSAAFSFGGQLALTMAYNASYVVPMIVGKLLAGVCAVILAHFLYKEKPDASQA